MDVNELEQQLSCPDGEKGIEVANKMHETNISMTLATVHLLDLKEKDQLLELGHGNAMHIPSILEFQPSLLYHGLEVSRTMHQEAKSNQNDDRVLFQLYDGTNIPLPSDTINKGMAVNTIYFWEQPEKLLAEIGRVLQSGGRFIITYGQKKYMQELPFVGDKFKLYDDEDMNSLVRKSGLLVREFVTQTEQVTSKTGGLIERTFTMAILVHKAV